MEQGSNVVLITDLHPFSIELLTKGGVVPPTVERTFTVSRLYILSSRSLFQMGLQLVEYLHVPWLVFNASLFRSADMYRVPTDGIRSDELVLTDWGS